MKKTYYDILEISENASDEIVRSAYKALAKKYHPDVYSGSKEEATRRMAEINEAYSVLSDMTKRREYDFLLDREQYQAEEDQTDNSSESSTPQQTQYYTETSSDDNMEQRKTSNTGCGGCLSKIVSLIGVIFIIFVVRGCIRNDNDSKEKVPSTPVSTDSQQELIPSADTNEVVIPSEDPTPRSMDEAWDMAVQEYLDSAVNEQNFDEKMILYTDALYLQGIEYAFKFKIYVERGGKNAADQPFAEAQGEKILNTLEKLAASFGEDIAASIYRIVINDCEKLIDERISDIAYYLGEVVDVKTADIDDLWELFLKMYGGAEEFYP